MLQLVSKSLRLVGLYFLISLVSFILPSRAVAARITLVMPQKIDKGEVFPVQVFLDTEGEQTVGTDLLFSFNRKDLEFVQVDQADFYPNYHQAKIYLDQEQIRYSGTSNYREYKQGQGLFATFFFKKKKVGHPSLKLIWEKNKTDDTNVIGINGKDLIFQKPDILYDDNLAVVPNSENANNGQVLGTSSLNDYLLDSLTGNVLGEATAQKWDGWEIIVLGGLAGMTGALAYFFFLLWKKKRKEREEQKLGIKD